MCLALKTARFTIQIVHGRIIALGLGQRPRPDPRSLQDTLAHPRTFIIHFYSSWVWRICRCPCRGHQSSFKGADASWICNPREMEWRWPGDVTWGFARRFCRLCVTCCVCLGGGWGGYVCGGFDCVRAWVMYNVLIGLSFGGILTRAELYFGWKNY